MLLRVVGLGLVMAFASRTVAGSDESQLNQITVEGQGEVRVKPDQVHVAIEVDGASACCSRGSETAWSSNAANNFVSAQDSGPSYALGAISLSARVKVTFELK
jgi:uncharacterized protein YggE